MVRINIVKRITAVLYSLRETHCEKLINQSNNVICRTLEECQNAAIKVGEIIEQNFECPENTIKLLEEYCEILYQLLLKQSIQREDVDKLDNFIHNILCNVQREPTKILVVFFPYKASMWDSFESIWLAAKEDIRCECKVVAIPYYKFDRESQKAILSYEGNDFPEYVPIIDYREFLLDREHPDIGYIHNPYDNCNIVTSVHPNYYSTILRKHIDKLIYVPYYITAGGVSEVHTDLPVYENVDYIVAQSQLFKRGFISTKYYNKVLPFGSPKFDRIVRMAKENPEMPQEWENIIGSKFTVMLNTSINCFLTDGELYIKKLWDIFKLFKDEKNVVLIWRPHPLLEATIKAMRWQLSESYRELKKYFIEQQIGILDTTSDITKTVIWCDAYMGESASSVVSLFDFAKKPIFILNNFICREFKLEEKLRISLADALFYKDKWWIISNEYAGLFCVEDNDWEQIDFVGRLESQFKWNKVHGMLDATRDNILMCPNILSEATIFNDISKRYMSTAFEGDKFVLAKVMFRYKDSVYFLSWYWNSILEWKPETRQYVKHEGIYSKFFEGQELKCAEHIMWEATCDDKNIFITSIYSNKLLKFDMETKRTTAFIIGKQGEGFSGIINDAELIYVAENKTGKIKCFDKQLHYRWAVQMPDSFGLAEDIKDTVVVHNKLIDMKDWIIAIPYHGNSTVKISKKLKKSIMLIPEFWCGATETGDGYNLLNCGMSVFAKKYGEEKLLVQRLWDGGMADVDIENNTYRCFYPNMSENSFDRFMEGQSGFEKIGKYNNFTCRESRLFSVNGFLDFLKTKDYSEIRKHQTELLYDMCEDLEGNCGKRIHDFVVEGLYS